MTVTRFRLDLAYDGAAFHGWARQEGLRTVQGVLEHWITTVLRLSEPAHLTVAGRTDAGVHARGQVAHVDLPTDTAASDADALAAHLAHRLGRVLPDDVVVTSVSPAPEGFDARFAAMWRRYSFRLADAPLDPLLRGSVVAVDRPLDVPAMADAATALVGLHDFAAFCKEREGATTIRDVLGCAVTRVDHGECAGTVAVELRADAFCHSMVRSVVGALVAVGTGRRDVAWFAGLLDADSRAGEVTVLPPHGLVLVEVGYPPDDRLAARQIEARARRDNPTAQEDA
ncbi:MAG: tRNA pseudouridine(38-40) synthase TruA [Propionibacteriaceae bacterium]|nr:tRNA pseudouridine(38-40) synthase TruA [Propionibacteriaceae bacterium]